MKKIYLTILMCLALSIAYAQFTISGDNTIYTGEGNVGIGVSNPKVKLEVSGIVRVNNGYLYVMANEVYTILRSSRTDGAQSGLLRTNGWGDFTFDKSVGIGYDLGPRGSFGEGNLFVAGNVGIGVTNSSGYKLAINGKAIAESVTVKLNSTWPDYVFEDSYKPKSLSEVESYIKLFKRFPEIPSAAEVKEKGIDLGDMNAKLLKKIEELTLLLIEQDKRIIEQDKKINALSEKVGL